MANLPLSFTDNDLCRLLSPHGTVISTRILLAPHGASRGVGFARMESQETCDRIIAMFHNKHLPGLYFSTYSITHFQCMYLILHLGSTGDPLIVKFADTGRKVKRNNNERFGGGHRGHNPYDVSFYTFL